MNTAVTKLQSVQSTAHFPELLFHDISLYNPWPALVVLHSSVNIDVYILYWSGFRTANVSNKKDVRFFLFLVRGLSHHYITQKLKYVQQQWFTFTFTFMHLADAFIQSDLHCIQVTVSTFYQLLLSLGIEPMILALQVPCSTSWATGKLSMKDFNEKALPCKMPLI